MISQRLLGELENHILEVALVSLVSDVDGQGHLIESLHHFFRWQDHVPLDVDHVSLIILQD